MKFAVGYQLAEPGEESFVAIVREFRAHVAAVYFAWVGMASGRSPVGGHGGSIHRAARERMETDLVELRRLGVRLDLLLNANCYGGTAMSVSLERKVRGVVDRIGEVTGAPPDSVTTTSPAIAFMLQRHYPAIDRRASVNLRLGTVDALRHVADLFDSFHVQRDFNRDPVRLGELKAWADAHGKRLHLLANSGCLRFCAGQTFHDNLVAHETENAHAENVEGFMPYTCWRLLAERANWPLVLRATWLRPEDVHRLAPLCDEVKLATRLHARPHLVLRAYAEGSWRGNLLDLLEPGYGPAFAPHVLDNARFPADWYEASCRHANDADDAYFAGVLEQVLVDLATAGLTRA